MLNLTNHEADHLARRAEKASNLLRELVYHHRQFADAMHVIGDEALEQYHRSMAAITLAAATDLDNDAADLRARRKPKAPAVPPDLHVGHIRPNRDELRRQRHNLERTEERAAAALARRA